MTGEPVEVRGLHCLVVLVVTAKVFRTPVYQDSWPVQGGLPLERQPLLSLVGHSRGQDSNVCLFLLLLHNILLVLGAAVAPRDGLLPVLKVSGWRGD